MAPVAESETAAPQMAMAPPPRPSIAERLRAAPLTFVIVAVNVIVFFVAENHGKTTETTTLLRFGACERYHVWVGQPWRLATSMFLHIGFLHLVWNAYGGLGWSWRVEKALGSARFLLLYLASGIAGSALSVLGRDVVSAGASGALFGLIGAELVIRWRTFPGWTEFINDRGVRSILTSIIVWAIIGATALAMDNLAHFGGLFAGALIAAVMLVPRGPTARRVAAACAAVVLGVLVVAAARPRWRADRDRDQVYAWAMRRAFGSPALRDVPLAKAFGERACAFGVRDGCVALASALVTGDAAAQRRGVELYREACHHQGSAFACAYLAILPPALIGDERAGILRSYRTYCESNDSAHLDACAAAGFIRLHTADTAEERQVGADGLAAACDLGDQLACWLDGRAKD
jgi:rhomboid protease GluP